MNQCKCLGALLAVLSLIDIGTAFANESNKMSLDQHTNLEHIQKGEDFSRLKDVRWQSSPSDSLEKQKQQESVKWKNLDKSTSRIDFLNSSTIWLPVAESNFPLSTIPQVVWQPILQGIEQVLDNQTGQEQFSEQKSDLSGLLWKSLPSLLQRTYYPKISLQWETIESNDLTSGSPVWLPLVESNSLASTKSLIIWEPLEELNAKKIAGEQIAPVANNDVLAPIPPIAESTEAQPKGLRWPNGQLMIPEDQIYYRTAYSRGSMIQIGDTVYTNLGMNALQRQPQSWVNLAISAIDDSWQWFGVGNKPDDCSQGNFLSGCADGLMENYIRLWASEDFSLDLQWTIHSLSGKGSPFNFTLDGKTFGSGDTGTAFGEGQSLGFKLSKNFGKTFGISLGANRLIHLDKTTDLSKQIYIKATKVFRLNDSLEPPIISLTLGLQTDVYNPDTSIGTVEYPEWLLGGRYPSIFAEKYSTKGVGSAGTYYSDVAGTSSAFVCADETIWASPSKSPTSNDAGCIKKVSVAPVASVGFAPWPWLGLYTNFTRNLNLGISVKPFREIDWNISLEMIAPIKGLNSRIDKTIKSNRCGDDDYSFSVCRTRIGLYTDLSF